MDRLQESISLDLGIRLCHARACLLVGQQAAVVRTQCLKRGRTCTEQARVQTERMMPGARGGGTSRGCWSVGVIDIRVHCGKNGREVALRLL